MKKLYSILFAVLLLLSSCAKDPDLVPPEIPVPVPNPDSHVVPVETALAELHAVLGDIDGQTRAGRSRSVAGVTSVRAADVLPATRSEETTDVEELVYIANFEGGEGYAILGADDRLATVIAITEQGSLTPEEFAAVARGEYSAEGDIPPVFPDVVNDAMGLGGGGLGDGGLGGGGIGGGGGGNKPITGDIDTGGGLPPSVQTYNRYSPWEQIVKRGPYIQTKWGQGVPYNFYTPVKNGVHCQVGCVAVALGQIIAMKFYKKYKEHEDLSMFPSSIKGSAIDWYTIFKTIDSYRGPYIFRDFLTNDYSHEALSVARFLYAVAVGIETKFGYDESMSYSKNVDYFFRTIGFAQVMEVDFSESKVHGYLSVGNPLFVSGFDNTKGHFWVIDGYLQQRQIVETIVKGTGLIWESFYRSRMFYHCNFGWRGKCDGYYTAATFYNPKVGPEFTAEWDVAGDSDRVYARRNKVILYDYYL